MIGNTTGKKMAILNHFGIYKLSIYKNSWKNGSKKNVFFYYSEKLHLLLKMSDRGAYLWKENIFIHWL